MRYILSLLLPEVIDQAIRTNYTQLSGHPLAINHLHVTLLPTFTLKPGYDINIVQEMLFGDAGISSAAPRSRVEPNNITERQSYHFGPPAFFYPKVNLIGNPILYLPVLPPDPLIELNSYLVSHISYLVDFDLSLYDNHQLPPYLPHLSLDYNFQGNQNATLTWQLLPPNTTFNLGEPLLFQETTPNQWDKVDL